MFGSLSAAVGFGLGLGSALLVVGLAVATNWRRSAERYTDWTDAVVPQTKLTTQDRWPAMLRQNRIIFGVVACFGGGLLLAGVTSVIMSL